MKIAIRVCDLVDTTILRIGRYLSWLNVFLILLIVSNALMRYAFSRGSVVVEELQWHIYGVCFLIGVPYAIVTNSHIRMDLFYGRFSNETKRWIEMLGILVLLLPFVTLGFLFSFEIAANAWVKSEASPLPMGLCCRWVIKGMMAFSFILIGMAGLSRLVGTFLHSDKEWTE
jgi:TRAP-type mannitol/chloroaromatic compound transport system permease small subunit